jgi:signal transduction histidine kinase
MGVNLINNYVEALKSHIAQIEMLISMPQFISNNSTDTDDKIEEKEGYQGNERAESERNIANVLKSSSSLLLKIFETTELVKESCMVALETLDDALTFDKIDENKLELETEFLDPLKFVENVMKPFQINAKSADIFLANQCEIHSFELASLSIKGDKFKLNQVIRNLLSNALKFTPSKGEVILTSEIICNSENTINKQVRISVKDSGCGISKENLPRLFGQYVQFNAGALQQGKGSGLGLWIAKSNYHIY